MRIAAALILPILTLVVLAACARPTYDKEMVERGRALVKLADCNDCHTEAFNETVGGVPEKEWLKGSRRGWYNEAGTKYAANLRLLASQIDEAQWIRLTRSMFARQPMYVVSEKKVTDSDLIAIYNYIRWLGPSGQPAPAPLPPGVVPPEPYIHFPNAH